MQRKMLRQAVMYLCLGLLVGVPGYRRAPEPPADATGAFTSHLDERVPRLMDRYDIPGASLALVRGGKVVWTGAYGYADRENQRRMTTDAVFRAESISKPVTAWGVMRLAEQGVIDLDSPVDRYLNELDLHADGFDARMVTVKRLLSNSSGLPLGPIGECAEHPPGTEMPSLEQYLSREAHLVREPGTAFKYSNVGFNTLELVVENVTGRNFAEYMSNDVLGPIGMEHSQFSWSKDIGDAMPVGYDLAGVPVPAYVYPASASGGLLATAEDIGHFVEASMTWTRSDPIGGTTDHAVLRRENVRRLHQPHVNIGGLFGAVADAYGLGHFIEALPDGRRAVWHGGQGHGWMTHVHAVPTSGDGIILLTNSERSWPMMARVLTDWADWSGVGSVKFGRIVYASTVLWGLVVLAAIAGLSHMIWVSRDWVLNRRHWDPFATTHRWRRGMQMTAGGVMLLLLIWSAAQPYLFVTSIFPIAAPWAGRAAVALAIALILSALLPTNEANHIST